MIAADIHSETTLIGFFFLLTRLFHVLVPRTHGVTEEKNS